MLLTNRGIIYGIRHISSNRWYIGQTVRGLKCRWKEHVDAYPYEKSHLYQAMRKYGLEQFEMTTLESDIPADLLDERERFYIAKYDAYVNGFNNTLGGQGVHGYQHTAECKARISAAMKVAALRYNTPERTAKIKRSLKGKPFTAAHIQHIREAAQAHKRYGADNSFGGMKHTEASKQLMSEAHRKNRVLRLSKDGELLQEYADVHEAANWVSESGLSKAKHISIYDRIRIAGYECQNTKTAYGFIWKFERISD